MSVYVSQARNHPDLLHRRYSFIEVLKFWYQRSQERRHLLELEERYLTDMGISRSQALAEAAKPFWQA